jgi:hypothetical protein
VLQANQDTRNDDSAAQAAANTAGASDNTPDSAPLRWVDDTLVDESVMTTTEIHVDSRHANQASVRVCAGSLRLCWSQKVLSVTTASAPDQTEGVPNKVRIVGL